MRAKQANQTRNGCGLGIFKFIIIIVIVIAAAVRMFASLNSFGVLDIGGRVSMLTMRTCEFDAQ